MNQVRLKGGVGWAELATFASGKCKLSFSVAVKEVTQNGERVDWIQCEVWNDRAKKLAEVMTKGSTVAVDGKLKVETWNAQDGTKRTKMVVAADIVLCQPKPDGEPVKRTTPGERKPAEQYPTNTEGYYTAPPSEPPSNAGSGYAEPSGDGTPQGDDIPF